ncbi:MAG: hypothetical protein P8Z30_07865 [Acidobacteriota bacterium]
MADRSLHSVISQNHRRVISVRMRLLEEYSLKLLDLFRPFESVLTSRPPLPPEKTEAIEGEIAAFRSRIRDMKVELGLEHAHRSSRREAAALISTMITYVEELHPRYLRGYGSVSEPMDHYLKDCLKDLSKTLEKISRILKDDSR